jgi:hypothetical protein
MPWVRGCKNCTRGMDDYGNYEFNDSSGKEYEQYRE